MYSNHCLNRALERTGYSEKSAIRFIQNGINRGISAHQIRASAERTFLANHSQNGITAKAYNGFCFIIDDLSGMCITIYALPHWFGKTRFYDGKEKIRKASKYYKRYSNLYQVYDC